MKHDADKMILVAPIFVKNDCKEWYVSFVLQNLKQYSALNKLLSCYDHTTKLNRVGLLHELVFYETFLCSRSTLILASFPLYSALLVYDVTIF